MVTISSVAKSKAAYDKPAAEREEAVWQKRDEEGARWVQARRAGRGAGIVVSWSEDQTIRCWDQATQIAELTCKYPDVGPVLITKQKS